VEPGPLAMTDGTGSAAAIWLSRDQLTRSVRRCAKQDRSPHVSFR
jgi:hypothetical protein